MHLYNCIVHTRNDKVNQRAADRDVTRARGIHTYASRGRARRISTEGLQIIRCLIKLSVQRVIVAPAAAAAIAPQRAIIERCRPSAKRCTTREAVCPPYSHARPTVARRVGVIPPRRSYTPRRRRRRRLSMYIFLSFCYSIIVITPDWTNIYTTNDSHYIQITVAAHQTILFLGNIFFLNNFFFFVNYIVYTDVCYTIIKRIAVMLKDFVGVWWGGESTGLYNHLLALYNVKTKSIYIKKVSGYSSWYITVVDGKVGRL